jgi:hypothetical protein
MAELNHPYAVAPNVYLGPASNEPFRSVTGTARLSGTSALCAIRDLVDGTFAVA